MLTSAISKSIFDTVVAAKAINHNSTSYFNFNEETGNSGWVWSQVTNGKPMLFVGYGNQGYHPNFGSGITLVTYPPVVYASSRHSPSITYSPNNGFVVVDSIMGNPGYYDTNYISKLNINGGLVKAFKHEYYGYNPHIYAYGNDKVLVSTWKANSDYTFIGVIDSSGDEGTMYKYGGGSWPSLALMSDGTIFESHGGSGNNYRGNVSGRLLKVADNNSISVISEYNIHGYGYRPSNVAYRDSTGTESIIEVVSAWDKLSDIRIYHIDPKTGKMIDGYKVIDSNGQFPTITLVKENKNDLQSYILEVNEQENNNIIRLIDPNTFEVLSSTTFAKGRSPSIAVSYDDQGKPYAMIVQESSSGAVSIKVSISNSDKDL